MSTILNSRSPYYLKYVPSGFPYEPLILSVDLSIYIYPGVFNTDKPTTPQYTLSKEPTEPEQDGDNNFVVYEISTLIRDYIYTNYYEVAQDAVWVEVDAVINYSGESPGTDNRDFLAFDGFGLFPEGVNPRTSTDPTQSSYTPQVLQDNTDVYFVAGKNMIIPIFSEPESTIVATSTAARWDIVDEFWNTTDIVWSGTSVTINVDDSDNTADKIQYIVIDTSNLADGDTITVTSTVGNPQQTILTARELCERRYDPLRVIYYNKYGALQDFYVNKKSVISTSTTDERYNTNIMDYTIPDYSVNKHSVKRFNVQGKQTILANTDYLSEDLNEPIKQMLVSESVWIEDAQGVIPVVVKDSSFTEKTRVNDKLIQYTFNFDYAYDYIQNVR